MFRFFWDFIRYPFDTNKKYNKFAQFLDMLLKQYPALLWIRPNFKKILALPFLIIYYILKSEKTSKK